MTLILAIIDIILLACAVIFSSFLAKRANARPYFNGITIALILDVVRRIDQLLILIDTEFVDILPPNHGLDTFNTQFISLAVSICLLYGLIDHISNTPRVPPN